ncbi:MAG: succinyl-diaminopimelate desuccinylase [Actinomycetota bacterium]|nr:succinyl-diaminopimelate desuccinylase [Actinomycetota bacterium]
MTLDLSLDAVALTEVLCNIESVSQDEKPIADEIEAALQGVPHLTLTRHGNSLVARTDLGRDERVVIAGHVDTVPLNDNLPVRNDGEFLHGLGTCDMKAGVAIALRLAADVTEPNRDLTFVFYECEEIDSVHNGLRKIAESEPELVRADFAVLMEPSDGVVEAGCQGTLRFDVITRGERAHSARSWKGSNAIHAASGVLDRLTSYDARKPVIDGLAYHEGLNAVMVSGGVATNVIPDECRMTVNYRFAPDRSEDEALAYVQEVFDGFELQVTDTAPGALPGLSVPAAAAFVESVGGDPNPKFGWTDVAQFTRLGVPAVNFGPGDPMFAHKQDEHVPLAQIRACEEKLRAWLATVSVGAAR